MNVNILTMTVWTNLLVTIAIVSCLSGSANANAGYDSMETDRREIDKKGDDGPLRTDDSLEEDENALLIRRKRGGKGKGDGEEDPPAPISSWIVPALSTPEGEANLTLNEGQARNTSIIFKASPIGLSYTLVNQSTAGTFSLYEDSGLLKLETDVDFETGIRIHTIIVEGVGEDESTSTVTVTILIADANDEPPIFSRSLTKVIIPDSTPSGTTIGGLTVTDADHTPLFRDVSLSISGGDTDSLFVVFDDGTLKVGFNKDLSNKTAYYLTIRAYDGVNEGTTNVITAICSAKILEKVAGSDVDSIHIAAYTTKLLSMMIIVHILHVIPYL